MTDKFPKGSFVRKIKGYRFAGTVLGTFDYADKPERFVNVQHTDGWVMHFREHELEATERPHLERGQLTEEEYSFLGGLYSYLEIHNLGAWNAKIEAIVRKATSLPARGMPTRENALERLRAIKFKLRMNLADYECEQIVDALFSTSATREEGWQPIETAPKDGTWIIGLSKQYGGTEVDRICWGTTRGGYETWCTRDGHYPLPSSITHWIPLPPSPPKPAPVTGEEAK